MKHKSNYIDDTLIRLRRQYGKDELVAMLNKKLSEKDVELGSLKSEIDHLNSQLILQNDQKEVNKLARVEVRKDELYNIQLEKIKSKNKRIKQLTQTRNDLIAKNNQLTNELL